ncbi:hypothetical protein Q9966_013320 [Columba livia]|nr:hypothetical protein Q9966_013320 [Columba livia]
MGGAPNYYPNSFSGPADQPILKESRMCVTGDVQRFNSANEDNVTQVRMFYTKVLNEEERQRLCKNIADHLKDAQLFIQKRAVKNFTDVHPDYGARIQALLDKYNADSGKNDRNEATRNLNLNICESIPNTYFKVVFQTVWKQQQIPVSLDVFRSELCQDMSVGLLNRLHDKGRGRSGSDSYRYKHVGKSPEFLSSIQKPLRDIVC